LLAEHRELHGLWNILTKHGGRGGYSRHLETLRIGKTKALYTRHEALVGEFARYGYKRHSPLDKKLAKGSSDQQIFINTVKEQIEILTKKPCECLVG
jgi:hypothetical protein